MNANDEVIRTASGVCIPTRALEVTAIRARGPGGQHVNKTSSAVQLQFDISGSAVLSDHQKRRLLAARDGRVSGNGIITIKAQRFRRQDRNRQDAIERLVEFIDRNLKSVRPRKATRPGKAAVERRLREKAARSRLKSTRRPPEG